MRHYVFSSNRRFSLIPVKLLSSGYLEKTSKHRYLHVLTRRIARFENWPLRLPSPGVDPGLRHSYLRSRAFPVTF